MTDRRDLRQRVIALIENGFSASEAGRRRRGGFINFKIMGSVKAAILQGARVVRQEKRTKMFSELKKRTRSALRTREGLPPTFLVVFGRL